MSDETIEEVIKIVGKQKLEQCHAVCGDDKLSFPEIMRYIKKGEMMEAVKRGVKIEEFKTLFRKYYKRAALYSFFTFFGGTYN